VSLFFTANGRFCSSICAIAAAVLRAAKLMDSSDQVRGVAWQVHDCVSSGLTGDPPSRPLGVPDDPV
jgi:hypothetical protein